MKVFTKLSDEQGNEIEHELDELAIFTSSEEIQQIIDFLTYVKEDHLVQHRDNNIAVTHSHFFQWKGKRVGKTDLQIWSTSNDWLTSGEMNNFIPEIPIIRCDFSLIGSAEYISQIEETMQWRGSSLTKDWAISSGDVRCNDTSLVTDIILNLLPEYIWNQLIHYQKEYDVESVFDLKIHCKESCFPFVILDRKIIRFLRETQTQLRLFALEEGSRSNIKSKFPKIRLKLVLKGEDMPFEQIEKMTGKNAVFKRLKDEFPESARAKAEDCWVYETSEFCVKNLQEMADSMYLAFSGKISHLINSEKSSIEINLYKNSTEEGISFETVIPKALISLADKQGISLFIGSYLVEK